ncbi:MAG: aldo/keto reductase [Anaerolineae bacterium]|nr:aldo/keto reductase [Anaerolineae bacterium]
METRILGRTGLEVTVMGFGSGGPSRAGQSTGNTEAESVMVIQKALDAGINFIDTAEAYRTESIVGKAIVGTDRSRLVISTKKSCGSETTPADVRASLETSLQRLGTDYVDVYHLHGVGLEDYDYLAAEVVPELLKLKDAGKVRHLGITEAWNTDTQHRMLRRALQDDVWDVMMVGFNLLNQSAREVVFPQTIAKNIGVLIMFAVRRALSRPEKLDEVIEELISRGQLDPADIDRENPLGFLIHEGGAVSLPDAAYRFCRNEPGTHVILSGTGDPAHLRENTASFYRPPLPEVDRRRLERIFRHVDSVTGQ